MLESINNSIKNFVEQLDKQHEEFLKIMQKLNTAEKNPDMIWEIFISIENYIRNHFSSEEKYMQELDYIDYEEHKALHQNFVEEYKEISNEITDYTSAKAMLPSLKAFIIQWLENHCKNEDKKLSSFLKDTQKIN